MGKRAINLTVEDDLVEAAKARGINMSELFRQTLKAQLNLGVDEGDSRVRKIEIEDSIQKLKTDLTIMQLELGEVKRKEDEKYGKVLKRIDIA